MMPEDNKSILETDNILENKGEIKKTIKQMTADERNELNKLCTDLYLKGIKPKNAMKIIQNASPNNISLQHASKLYYDARMSFMKSMPQEDTALLQFEAVKEMEELEEDVRTNITRETPQKYDVILNTKKHKHLLQGIGNNTAPIEINISSNLDKEFLSSQNKFNNVVDADAV